MQTSGTAPMLSNGTRKTIITKAPKFAPAKVKLPMPKPGKGKKGC